MVMVVDGVVSLVPINGNEAERKLETDLTKCLTHSANRVNSFRECLGFRSVVNVGACAVDGVNGKETLRGLNGMRHGLNVPKCE